ncbi:MAG: hypothetical protein NTY53_06520 [Kiritimatiellaeota bacterium]|nr:hypothetical protein [Kiritimatiellota bacterium]
MLLLVCALMVLRTQAGQPSSTLHAVDKVKTVDTSTYAGAVTAIDATKFTMTINGHELTATVHQKTLVRDNSNAPAKKKPQAKESPKDASRHFLIDPGCRVIGLDKIPIPLNGISTNNVVVAKYSTTKDFERKTKFTIEEIVVTKSK